MTPALPATIPTAPAVSTAVQFVFVDFDTKFATDLVHEKADSATAESQAVRWKSLTAEAANSDGQRVIVILVKDRCRFLHALKKGRHDAVFARKNQRIVVVTDIAVHFDCPDETQFEQRILTKLEQLTGGDDSVVLRVGTMFGLQRSPLWSFAKYAWPGLGRRPRCGFVSNEELVRILDEFQSTREDQPGRRKFTYLGRNRSWAEEFRQRSGHIIPSAIQQFVFGLLYCIGLGLAFQFVLYVLTRLWPALRAINYDTIYPGDEDELISLCSRQNVPNIEVCGYNNGVKHFGWVHPQKTVVPTIRSGHNVQVEGDRLTVDAGVTLRRCIDVLAEHDREFFVVPNFSYIAIGTTFFVPVHGSGSEVSTLGDSIESVRFFDPATDRIVTAERGDERFRQTMYNRNAGVILLSLQFRIRPRADYFCEKTTLDNPSAEQVWNLFHDLDATNIEVRKNSAENGSIDVAKFYLSSSDNPDRMAIPRDQLGRLWDRLEENRVTAFWFHYLVRRFAWHVELFLTEAEFAVFWEHHSHLPISKIQLRYVRRDGLPHSPFGNSDCISADLFMLKNKRDDFQAFVSSHLPNVRFNPGKQSMDA